MFSIVLVTYNSAHVIGDAIRSIPEGNQVIVVDNASSDDSVALARSLGAEVVELSKNFGFGTACNRGAERARFERLLFLNPDARLETGALEALRAGFETHSHAGAFNPRIFNQHGQQVFRRRTKLLRRHYLFRPPTPDRDAPIVVATGAALAIRKVVFNSISGFDEDLFLYFEDDDISVRIQHAGWRLMYIHDAVCSHTAGTSTVSSNEIIKFKEYQYITSMIKVLKKHNIKYNKLLNKFVYLVKFSMANTEEKKIKYGTYVRELRILEK